MWLVILRENRFKLLFLLLLFLFLVMPIIMESFKLFESNASRWILLAGSCILLTTATYAVSGRRNIPYFLMGLMICSLSVELISALLPSSEVEILHHAIRIAFFSFLIIGLLRIVFNPKKVTYDTISASLCIYLLLGILWANFYAICEAWSPGSIGMAARQNAQGNIITFDMTRSFRMLYFSFVTISTVGYGDVVPQTPMTRMLAVSEAIIGQIYLLVMVSRLVGIHVSQAMTPMPGNQESPQLR